MLPGEDGRGHEYGDLHTVGNALEGRAQRDLGLTEADVAAEQAVHRDGALHIALDLGDRLQLAVGLSVFELRLELLLQFVVGRERMPLHPLAGGVERDQLLRDALRRAFGLRLGALPLGRAHFRQLRDALAAAADVFADQIKLVAGYIQTIAARVLQFDVIARDAMPSTRICSMPT